MMAGAQTQTLEKGRSDERLAMLDGLRCIAVVSVVLFHYLYFWTSAGAGLDLVAYGDRYAHLPFVAVGGLGVQLFFAISGFVILMTLERTSSLKEFLVRRAIRLWPPLIMFGTLTFVIVGLCGPHDLRVGAYEYVISLFFLPPEHVGKFVGNSDWKWLDGAYWSLWVEVRFYIVIGVIYFLSPRHVVWNWALYEVVCIAVGLASLATGMRALDMLEGLLFQSYVPYFSLGLVSYRVFTGRSGRDIHALAVIALVHIVIANGISLSHMRDMSAGFKIEFLLAQISIVMVFYFLSLRSAHLRWLEHPLLVHLGRSSYGTYLMHQNVGLTVLALPVFSGPFMGAVGVVLVGVAVFGIAWANFQLVERRVQKWLGSWLIGGRGAGARQVARQTVG